MNAMKILLPVLLLIGAGAGAWYAFSGPSVEPSLTPPPERVVPEVPQQILSPAGCHGHLGPPAPVFGHPRVFPRRILTHDALRLGTCTIRGNG